jgi:hypothetical protein
MYPVWPRNGAFPKLITLKKNMYILGDQVFKRNVGFA